MSISAPQAPTASRARYKGVPQSVGNGLLSGAGRRENGTTDGGDGGASRTAGRAAPGPRGGGAAPSVHREQSFTPPPSRESVRRARRAHRAEVREELRAFSVLPRLRSCGRTAVDGQGVMVRCTSTADGPRAGFAGLATCGSVWACPVCAAKVAAARAAELAELLEQATSQGYRVAFVTLTVRHHLRHSLRAVWDAVAAGWRRVISGKGWTRDKARYDVPGWVRAVETTHGRANGWHVHVHAVLLYRGDVLDGHALGHSMFNRWHAGVTAAGFDAVSDSGGLNVQVPESGADLGRLGAYLAKQGADLPGLASEAVTGAFKTAKGGNRTPFQIAADLVRDGDADDLDLWNEWERTSKGRRQLTWSKGLRERFALADELTDEELAAVEVGTADDDVVLLPGDTWRAVRARSWELLDVVETSGRSGLVAWLDRRGLEWGEPPRRE